MKKIANILFIFCIALLVALPSCYTKIRSPQSEENYITDLETEEPGGSFNYYDYYSPYRNYSFRNPGIMRYGYDYNRWYFRNYMSPWQNSFWRYQSPYYWNYYSPYGYNSYYYGHNWYNSPRSYFRYGYSPGGYVWSGYPGSSSEDKPRPARQPQTRSYRQRSNTTTNSSYSNQYDPNLPMVASPSSSSSSQDDGSPEVPQLNPPQQTTDPKKLDDEKNYSVPQKYPLFRDDKMRLLAPLTIPPSPASQSDKAVENQSNAKRRQDRKSTPTSSDNNTHQNRSFSRSSSHSSTSSSSSSGSRNSSVQSSSRSSASSSSSSSSSSSKNQRSRSSSSRSRTKRNKQ